MHGYFMHILHRCVSRYLPIRHIRQSPQNIFRPPTECNGCIWTSSECEQGSFVGCYTDGVANCRTCYLSESIYMNVTGTRSAEMPLWVTCPCCVTTTLASGHEDLEVSKCRE